MTKHLDNKEKAERIRAHGCENGEEEAFCSPFFLGSEFTVPCSLFPVPPLIIIVGQSATPDRVALNPLLAIANNSL
jgi:hypothetical protein